MMSVLVLLVMLPAIVFSVYEFTTLSRSETLIAGVYRQQLDVVLFSLNQYAWDVANSWANATNDALTSHAVTHKDFGELLKPVLTDNPGIRCVFVAEPRTDAVKMFFPSGQTDGSHGLSSGAIVSSLKIQNAAVTRLLKLQTSGYRKIEPMYIANNGGESSLALVFVAGPKVADRQVVGIVIAADNFVRDVLSRKMEEAAGDNFLLSVNQKQTGRVIFATGDLSPEEARQTKDLWLFPDYTIGIRLRGQTIDDVVRARFYRNLLLIGLLNVVLIAGVWMVYRTVRREVELAQLKSDFVSNVSHEIKTPLALIRMFGETLQLKRVKSERKKQEYYNTIVQETERLTRLINNILNFSRMEAGKKEYRFESVDLNELVCGILTNYAAHLEHEGFRVVRDIDGRLPQIEADSGALSEALLNIIDNAVKYSREHKFLRVATGIDGAMVFVEVEDQGIGIDQQQQKMIFEKFYRVSSGLVHHTRGTGLGLTLVKHIMDAHHGTISLKSEAGRGSTFRLSLPVELAEHS